MTRSDDALVAEVGEQSRDALGEIYRRYGGAVWWVANRVCRSAERAEEVCQAVFTELWSRPERFDPSRGVLRSFLVAEAHARAVEAARPEKTDEVARPRERDEAEPASLPSTEAEVAGHAAALAKRARQAVDKLASAERDAILLAYFGGPAYIDRTRPRPPEDTVKSRIRRGLENLRRTLEAEGVTT